MDLEQRFLSETIHDDPRTSSPTRRHRSRSRSRSRTPSPIDTDDELGSGLDEAGREDDVITESSVAGGRGDGFARGGGAQTGVKGVLQDAKDLKALSGDIQKIRARERNERIVKGSFQALTVHEEDELRKHDAQQQSGETDEEVQELQRRREARRAESIAHRHHPREDDHDDEDDGDDDRARHSVNRRGHNGKVGLREVGAAGFLNAVERPGWVVVLLHEPDIQRCRSLSLALLGIQSFLSILPPRMRPNQIDKSSSYISNSSSARPSLRTDIPLLLRARASELSFSLLPTQSGTHRRHDSETEDEEGRPESRSDPDVLPTLLAYRDGELEHTWIRVDWEVGGDGEGLERLLSKHGIMPGLKQSRDFGSNVEDQGDD